jgi:Fe2+ transport system protein FeoA
MGLSRNLSRMAKHALPPAPTGAAQPEGSAPIPLSSLRDGAIARFKATAELDPASCDLLRALGLTRECQLTLCKAGEPCIVQVRSTRIGLSRTVANGIMVVPEPNEG